MGYLGFLFLRDGIRKVVFVENKKVCGALVIGFESSFDFKNCNLIYLNSKLSFEPFLIFEINKIKYAKISVSSDTFVDFDNLTIWFNPRKYQKLRDLFGRDCKDDGSLKSLVLDLYDLF